MFSVTIDIETHSFPIPPPPPLSVDAPSSFSLHDCRWWMSSVSTLVPFIRYTLILKSLMGTNPMWSRDSPIVLLSCFQWFSLNLFSCVTPLQFKSIAFVFYMYLALCAVCLSALQRISRWLHSTHIYNCFLS